MKTLTMTVKAKKQHFKSAEVLINELQEACVKNGQQSFDYVLTGGTFNIDGVAYTVVIEDIGSTAIVKTDCDLDDINTDHLVVIKLVFAMYKPFVLEGRYSDMKVDITIPPVTKWDLVKALGPYAAGLIILAGGGYLTYRHFSQ